MDYDRSKVIVLTDELGTETELEYIDSIEFETKRYALFMPLENDDDEVIILQYDIVSEAYDSFVPVSDNRILEGVYEALRKKYEPQLKQLDDRTGEDK